VAAGSSQNSVLVWNLATRSLTAQLPQADPVTSVAWDGDGRLAAGDEDGTVSFWSLPSPILLAGAPVNSVAFSSDDRMQLWDPARSWPRAVTTAPFGSGRFLLRVRLALVPFGWPPNTTRAATCSRWPSARTARRWPPRVPTA
jgi:hypothetical protein